MASSLLLRYKSIITSALAIIALLVPTACEDTNHSFTGDAGTITPSISIDPAIVSDRANNIADLGYDIPVQSDFTMVISDDKGEYEGVWPSMSNFSTTMLYKAGNYTMKAYTRGDSEGFVAPRLQGATTFTVKDGSNTDVKAECSVASAIVTVEYSAALAQVASEVELTLQSSSGLYFPYPAANHKALMLSPGDIDLYMKVTLTNGKSVTVNPGKISNAQAAHHYVITADAGTGESSPAITLTIATPGEGNTILTTELTDELFSGTDPVVQPIGFTPGTPIVLTEGTVPAEKVGMTVIGAQLSSVKLTTISPGLIAQGMPAEVDLINASAAEMATLTSLGLSWDGMTLDLCRLLSKIEYEYGEADSRFTVVARDIAGRINYPVTLEVTMRDATITINNFTAPVIGIDRATVRLVTDATDFIDNFKIQVLDNGSWRDAKILGVANLTSQYEVTFEVPAGVSDVMVRVFYNDRPLAEQLLSRVSPTYTAMADPFARRALIRITAYDEEQTEMIMRYITVWNGATECSIYNRNAERGIIEIIGLEPSTVYNLTVTVLPKPDDTDKADHTVNFKTEEASEVPNGNFEDTETTLKYDNLPSGGRYSQTTIDIYNRQNRKSYDILTPKKWATTNPKTFCMAAKNKNTWYMQPSAQTASSASAGSYSMMLTNVAWDVDGPQIPDYRQIGTPYINYNPNIPEIAHRAAGRMWLGSYSFDAATCSETITEGIAFKSRPAALNGTYRYVPRQFTNNERGIAIVKVWGTINGEEVLIASGSTLLGATPNFSPFSVPLKYEMFGVKATKLTVILSASSAIGDIDYETANVMTYPDAVTATSIGNSLWIDNLTFAY